MSELGFYSPGKSVFHRIHPLSKILIFGVAITLLPLINSHWQSNLILALALIIVISISRIRRRQIIYFSPALGLIIITAISWLFTNLGGKVVLEFTIAGFHYILRENTIRQAITMSLRALDWVLSYVILLTTTSSRDMMAGLEKMGLSHRASTAVGMTLKFWANVMEDTRNVMDAQRVRGVDFDRGSKWRALKQRIIVSAIPTIFLMLKRFRTLSYALSLRAFEAPGRKTRVYAPGLTSLDTTFLVIASILLILIGFIDQGALLHLL